MSEKPYAIGISKAPEDPQKKKEWVSQMVRVQVAMWLPCTCEHCGYTYKSVDDFLRCNPRRGHTKDMSFVCDTCYPEYAKLHPLKTKEKERIS